MSSFVLVTGATGNQGGAVARALLAAGTPVHAFVRTPEASAARQLAAAGATLVTGDLDDPASLRTALDGARGVFSVQTPGLTDVGGETETRHARNVASAAASAGVAQIVHTSVSGADLGQVDEQRWGTFPGQYRAAKAAAEQYVRDAGTARWTILRPALFLENLVRPSFYFPDPGRPNHLLVALDLDVAQPWVALRDIGTAAAAAFADPARFDRVELELAGELRSLREIAAILSDVTGEMITVPDSPQQAVAEGVPVELARYQDYVSANPYPARPEHARALGLPTTGVADWARTTFPQTTAT